jgi:hypothetical protein
MKLSKQLIKRFKNPNIAVRLINGRYKMATATVTYSNGCTYIVEVTRVHKLTEMFGGKEYRKFLSPTSKNSHDVIDVPPELEWVADKLYELAYISDEDALLNRESILKLLSDHF